MRPRLPLSPPVGQPHLIAFKYHYVDNEIMGQTKSDLIRQITRWVNNGDWQDLSMFIEAQGMMTDKDVVRITLEELNKRNLLVPLILKTFEENIVDWRYIDTISGNYAGEIAPQVLSKLRKVDLQKIIEFYGDVME
jgi:hypothetical protein